MASATATSSIDMPPPLTPVPTRRKKRASASPLKLRQSLAASRAKSESPVKQVNALLPQPVESVDSAALNFKEFSFWNDDHRRMQGISSNHLKALDQFLYERYDVMDIQLSLPLLYLWCKGSPPPIESRPFSIAGAVAVWLGNDEENYVSLSLGEFSPSDDMVTIDDELAADLKIYKMPKPETISRLLRQYFPDAVAISFIFHTIVVEFDEVERKSWLERLQGLPHRFENVGVALEFSNGPLVGMELKRLKKPMPAVLDTMQEDDSNYVKSGGCFYPGAMIKAESGGQISAGIAVEKAGDTRLTVAFHCWDSEYESAPEKLGHATHFSVTQGETRVGYVQGRIGTTDIGLAKLDDNIAFQNRFLDLDTTARCFLPFDNINISDEFLFDSFVTGKQRMRCAGVRIRKAGQRREELVGNKEHLPDSGNWIELCQGIYATGSPEIRGAPKIRAGVYGSALIRVSIAGETNDPAILQRGEVAGFMHWSDLRRKNDVTGQLFCFAQSAEDLMQEGWSVVQVAEKRKEESREATVVDDDFPTQKKRK